MDLRGEAGISDVLTLAAWREEIGRHLMRLDFEPSHDFAFHASVEPLLTRPALRVTRCRLGRGQLSRNAELAKHGRPSHTLLIAGRSLSIRHRGREVDLLPGDATLLRDFEPGQVGGAGGVQFTALTWSADVPGLRDVFDRATDGRRLPRALQALAMLRRYLGLVSHSGLGERPSGLDAVAERQMLDLTRMALDPDLAGRADGAPCRAAARLRDVLDLIARHYADPRLTPDVVAGKAGISRRYLFQLLEDSGATFGERVMARRLATSHAALTAEGEERGVGEIALAAGFSDLSHFNRSFRARYGMSPSEARRARS